MNSTLLRLRSHPSSLRVHRRYRSTHRTRTRPTHTPHRTGPIRTPRTHRTAPALQTYVCFTGQPSITLPPVRDRPAPLAHTQDRTMQHHATHLLLSTHQTPLCIRGLAVWKSLLNAQRARRPREAPPDHVSNPPHDADTTPGYEYDDSQSRNGKRYPRTPPSIVRHHD